jgi:D-glycero-alpha-D-manno-heptose 1-phosphate guanylyltransferase
LLGNIIEIMIQAPLIVLAGGFGTRLNSVLKGLPKPLADINGTPFLQHLFQNWRNQGFNDFILALHYESEKIIDFVESLKANILNDCTVRYITEQKPMGTGGAIAFLINETELADEFFVANADTWVREGYTTLYETEGNVIGIVEVNDASRYGNVCFDVNNVITHFEEKNDKHDKGYINAGIYKLSKSLFDNLDCSPFSLELDLFPKLVTQKSLKCKVIKTDFIDIGIPEDYFAFCKIK